jgi:chorismate mutase/prephenate dehydratase
MIDLDITREKIDRVDRQMVELFQERMELAKDVAEYKLASGKPVFDKERERSKLDTLGGMGTNEFNSRGIRELFAQIMSLSRKFQYGMLPKTTKMEEFQCLNKIPIDENTKVVYFGVPGTHTHQAMGEFFGDKVKPRNALTFREVMELVQKGEVDYGILPIENSSTGGITDNYDLLMEYDNYIVGEHYLKINQALLGLPGAKIENLTKVYSHPQGLLQCSTFFDKYPSIRQKEYDSTAAAAMKVAEDKDITHAAIAGVKAAECYGLEVLEPVLNRESGNSTRFIVISKKPIYVKNSNKVSICFEVLHESGTLVDILSHFKFNDLNMTKIESRPIPGRTWEYRFVIEFEGNLNDPGVKNALNGIFEEAVKAKILGNFVTK